ncbi:hypothetical protein NLI96_g10332 [Meripilus lineatus]|uniref:Uncharacterized protein n=1 Tax=Meripilus lineatus TaxID=2056292 RepID=A0AAD5YEB8_9APHY|nr:hypothetical protein NLI96_g10332 [Physisporinus lineatus]
MASQPQRRYSLRKTNDPNPGKTAGVFKRTMKEIKEEAAVKKAVKEAQKKEKPARGKSQSQQHTEWANSLAGDIRRFLQEQEQEYSQALKPPSCSIDADDHEVFVPSVRVPQKASAAVEPPSVDQPLVNNTGDSDGDISMGEFRALSPVDWNLLDELLDEGAGSGEGGDTRGNGGHTEAGGNSNIVRAPSDDSDSESEAFRMALKRRSLREIRDFDLDDDDDEGAVESNTMDVDRETADFEQPKVCPLLPRVSLDADSVALLFIDDDIVDKPTRKERRLRRIANARSAVFEEIGGEPEDRPESPRIAHKPSAAASKKEKPLVSHEDGGLRHDWRNGIMPPHKTKASSRRRRNSESDGEGLKDEDVFEERPRKEKGRGKQMSEIVPPSPPPSQRQAPSNQRTVGFCGASSNLSTTPKANKKIPVAAPVVASSQKTKGVRALAGPSSNAGNAPRPQGEGQSAKRKSSGRKQGHAKRQRPASIHSLGKISDGGPPTSSSISESENDEPEVNPNEAWQRQAAKSRAILATVFEWDGMQEDPWVIDLSPTFLAEFLQAIVDHCFAAVKFTVTKECPFYTLIRQSIHDWRRYFLRASTRMIASVLALRNNLRIIKKTYVTLDVGAIMAFTREVIDNKSAFYEVPHHKHPVGPYCSPYMLHTYVCAHHNKIRYSFLSDIVSEEDLAYPCGAMLLAAYVVQLGLSQFRTGHFQVSPFKKMTELGIWQGHTANIMQELSEVDLQAFLEAAREHRLADGPYHVEMPTTAFTAAPRIVSNHN